MDTRTSSSRRWTLNRRRPVRPENTIQEESSRLAARGKGSITPSNKSPGEQTKHQRFVMGRPHHNHHRRAPQADAVDPAPTIVLTVNVEIIATVDSSGNVLGQETRTQADPMVPTPASEAPNAGTGITPPVAPVPAAPIASAVVDAAGAIVSPVVALPAAVESAIPSVAALSPPAASISLPVVPSVPAFPTLVLPTVPSVPAVPSFPSDLRVPSYPWPSGLSVIAAAATAAPTLPLSASPSIVPPSTTPAPAASHTASNATISNTSSLSGSNQNNTSGANSVHVLSAGSSTISPSMDTLSVSGFESSTSSQSAGTATSNKASAGAGGVGGSPNTAASPGQTAPPVGAGSSSSSPPLPTPQVVGSVVGSLAGAALILAVILLLLRRHKRKRRGALQLTDDHHDGQPVMAHSSPRNNRIPSAFLNRFSGMSRSTAETSTSGGERGFQRVSGRKLPSAFSEGMTSEQFSRGGAMSGSSFYQDDHATYGGSGLSKEFGKEIGSPMAAGAGAMSIRPSPARTPVIRHPDDNADPFADPAPFPRTQSHLSPPQSPDPDLRRGTLGRTLHSADGSRSSKFTENV